MKKQHKQSPLPFQGQKRNFLKHFKEALNQFPDDAIYVDLFGGSGLLSHTVKCQFPSAKVIYNDFDNFQQRINSIPKTNIILSELRNVLHGCARGKRITGEYRAKVIEILSKHNETGYVDWISISSSLLFSMNYHTNYSSFVKETFYNKVRKSDFDASNYLDGVKVVSCSYKKIFEEYKSLDNVVFLVDPPYLSTDTATYNSNGYWKLKDYLDVVQVLNNNDYFYFTSNKSHIVELCEWIGSVSNTANPFEKAFCTKINTSTSHNAKYIDIMYHYVK